MDEQNQSARRRERIKTALIIFLIVLLLLTFFSNTIMNHTLPEITAEYAGYGTITETVRGSGVITASQIYEVKATGNRPVASVKIKPGDTVKAGDTLFVLGAAQSGAAIKEAEDALASAELAYQKALLTEVPDYSEQNQEIANAQEDLEIAVRRRDEAIAATSSVTQADYEAAQADAAAAASNLEMLTGYQLALESGETDLVPAEYTDPAALQAAIDAENEQKSKAEAVIQSYESGSSEDIAALEDGVTQQERKVQSLMLALEKTKREDELAKQIKDLDLRAQEEALEKQRTALENMKKNAGTLEIKSQNAGVVSSVNVAAGDAAADGDTLAQLTLTEAGYTVSFPVTAEQARKVTVGASAQADNGYLDISARLIANRADTENPGSQDRLLTFEVTGSAVVEGDMVSLAVTCSSSNYECVVPSSAVMTDNEGNFLLRVRAESSPLGNRYYVERVGVKVLASDEINSAVSGEVNESDFVVTASEVPLNPGDQVRMEET